MRKRIVACLASLTMSFGIVGCYTERSVSELIENMELVVQNPNDCSIYLNSLKRALERDHECLCGLRDYSSQEFEQMLEVVKIDHSRLSSLFKNSTAPLSEEEKNIYKQYIETYKSLIEIAEQSRE